MPKIKLIPREYSLTNAYATNQANMLTDVSSDTYGRFHSYTDAAGWIYLNDFDFSLVPDGVNIVSVKYKIKILTKTPVCSIQLMKLSSSSVALCEAVTVPNDNTVHIIELTPNVSFDTIKNYPLWGSEHPFAFKVFCDANSANHYIYGAEIEVTYNSGINKVVYDGATLIDLTSDTVTAADVLSGIIFHLPNGRTAIGTLTPVAPELATKSSSSSTSRQSLRFSVIKEPSFFVALNRSPSSISSSSQTAAYVIYDGSSTNGYRATYSSSANGVYIGGISIEFTYSSGTLTLSSYFYNAGTWVLYYF